MNEKTMTEDNGSDRGREHCAGSYYVGKRDCMWDCGNRKRRKAVKA